MLLFGFAKSALSLSLIGCPCAWSVGAMASGFVSSYFGLVAIHQTY